MTHAWHDVYHHEKTPAHHLDPRSKLAVAFLFIGFVLLTPVLSFSKGVAYASCVFLVAISCHVSPVALIRRVSRLIPFVLLMGVSASLSHVSADRIAQILVKACLSMGAMAVVSAAVPFPDMLRALQKIRVPRFFLLFLAFLYRYGAVLAKETGQLERGWKSRYYGRLWRNHWKELGHVLSALLVRSYERAERVYAAMLARGFSLNGPDPRVLHWSKGDIFLVLGAGVILSGIHWGHF